MLIGSASALDNPVYTIAALIVVMVLALLAAPAKVTGTVALGAMLGYLLARPLILLMQRRGRAGRGQSDQPHADLAIRTEGTGAPDTDWV